jgi:hypothetical protein
VRGFNTLIFDVSGAVIAGVIAGIAVLPAYRDGDHHLCTHCPRCLCVHRFGPIPPRFGAGDGQRLAPCGWSCMLVESRERPPYRLVELVGAGPVEIIKGAAFAIGRPQGLRCWHC